MQYVFSHVDSLMVDVADMCNDVFNSGTLTVVSTAVCRQRHNHVRTSPQVSAFRSGGQRGGQLLMPLYIWRHHHVTFAFVTIMYRLSHLTHPHSTRLLSRNTLFFRDFLKCNL